MGQPVVEDWRAMYPTTPVTNSADVPVAVAFDRLPHPPQPFTPSHVFVAGRKVYVNTNSTYTIVKYALDGSGGLGTIVEEVEWPPVTGNKVAGRAPVAMAIMDVSDNGIEYHGLFVTGVVEGPDGTTNWLTVGYNINLDLLWTAEFNYQPIEAEVGGNDVPVGIAATAYPGDPGFPHRQRVIVTGTSQGLGTGTDMQTVVYDAVDGQEVYGRRFTTAGVADEIPAGVSAINNLYWTVCTEPNGAGRRLRVFCYDLYTGDPHNPGGLNKWGTSTNPGLVLSIPSHHLDAVGVGVTIDPNNAWVGGTATPFFQTGQGKNMAFARVPADTPPAQNSAPEVFDSTNHYNDVATCMAVGIVPGIVGATITNYFCIAGYAETPGEGRQVQAVLYTQHDNVPVLERWRTQFGRQEHLDDDEAVVISMSGPSSSPQLPGGTQPDLDVFIAARTRNAAGFWDALILKYDSDAEVGGGNKVRRWFQEPRAYGNNPGDDVPAGIAAYSAQTPGANIYLHRVFTTIRSFDFSANATGTNWLTIKHKEVPPP
ncbi:MAG: hypothetical protein ACKVW3_05920 [Phycisphaerales bacterium]